MSCRRLIKIGYSTFKIHKINNVWYKKRLFCIFDKDLPYKLTIEYYKPYIAFRYNVVFKMPLLVTEDYEYYSFKIDTEETCKKIINKIKKFN